MGVRARRPPLGVAAYGWFPFAPTAEHVDAALEYLGCHFADDADLPTVAAEVGSSPHHLSGLFRAGTGATLSAHRMELRVRAAVERIAAGAEDLSAVACDVGFFDHAHMARTFRRTFGTTPSQIRSDLTIEAPN